MPGHIAAITATARNDTRVSSVATGFTLSSSSGFRKVTLQFDLIRSLLTVHAKKHPSDMEKHPLGSGTAACRRAYTPNDCLIVFRGKRGCC